MVVNEEVNEEEAFDYLQALESVKFDDLAMNADH